MFTQDGFSITVVNAISPMRITKPSAENLERLTIKLDEEKLNLKDFFIHYKDIVAPYIDLTPLEGFLFDINDSGEIIYRGGSISLGKHILEIIAEDLNPIFIKVELKFHQLSSEMI